MISFDYEYCNKAYKVVCENNKIIIITDGPDGKEYRETKVYDNSSYVFKVNKNSISGQGGAYGVFKFLEDFATGRVPGECYINMLIDRLYNLTFDFINLTDSELLSIQCQGKTAAKNIIKNHGFGNMWSYHVADNYLFFTCQEVKV